jgi:hypothetical protein
MVNSKMVASASTMACLIAHGMPTSNVVVADLSLEPVSRFHYVDLTNTAKRPVKSTYGSKQRNRKYERKGARR